MVSFLSAGKDDSMFFNLGETLFKDKLSKDLIDNLHKLEKIYDIEKNSDIIIREFSFIFSNKKIHAFIIFIDGLVKAESINNFVLRPLMALRDCGNKHMKELISESIIPYCEVEQSKVVEKIIKSINEGNTVLIVDGINDAWMIDTKGYKERNVERSLSEVVIRGPHQSFTENIRTNTSLIRKIMKNKELITEEYAVGEKSNTPCALMYDKSITDERIVEEARKRIQSLKIEFLFDSGQMERYIEDQKFRIFPQMLSTERPDHVSLCLSKGQVALVVDGSPHVLVFPTTISQLSKASEDEYLRTPYSIFILIIRSSAYVISLFLTPFFVAISTYHSFLLPLDILFAIEASYEKVPFSTAVEFIWLEFAFELIREASTRMPAILGSTLGIIGGLIIGEATVDANLVSPIGIIIIAIVAISTFAIPNYFVGYGIRISKFIGLFLASISGFLGLSAGFFLFLVSLSDMRSFNRNYFSGVFPSKSGGEIKICDFYSDEFLLQPEDKKTDGIKSQ